MIGQRLRHTPDRGGGRPDYATDSLGVVLALQSIKMALTPNLTSIGTPAVSYSFAMAAPVVNLT